MSLVSYKTDPNIETNEIKDFVSLLEMKLTIILKCLFTFAIFTDDEVKYKYFNWINICKTIFFVRMVPFSSSLVELRRRLTAHINLCPVSTYNLTVALRRRGWRRLSGLALGRCTERVGRWRVRTYVRAHSPGAPEPERESPLSEH